MFLKCSERKANGKTYKYYNVVESTRIGGKVKHNILFPLGTLSDEKAERIRNILKIGGALDNSGRKLYRLSDIIITKTLDFLNIYILHRLWCDWKLDSFFQNYRYIEKLVINRCISPMSKYRTSEWEDGELIDKLNNQSTPEPFGAYDELDRIADSENEIQNHLCSLLKEQNMLDNQTIIYDITSTFFERTRCTLAFRGYSRDHRPDKLQIVIAMAINSQGYPFYWKVYNGNTPDVTTVEDFTDQIIRLIGATDFLFVFDRGMVSHDNIAYIEEKKYRFISAIDRNEISTSTPVDVEQFGGVDNQNYLERLSNFSKFDEHLCYHEYQSNGHRYIIGFDLKKQLDERQSRKNRLERFDRGVCDLNQNLSEAKRDRSKDAVVKSVESLIKKAHLKKAIQVVINNISVPRGKKFVQSFSITYEVDQNALYEAGLTDGLTCFYTNTSPDDFSAAAVIRQYRDKNAVEEGFHEIKGVIELRPIFLSLEKRVRAHVTICILAYLLYNSLEKRVSAKLQLSASDILIELAKCKSTSITVESGEENHRVLTRFTQTQLAILDYLCYSPKSIQRDFKMFAASAN